MEKKRGVFIVFEGIDGCGKSTQIKEITPLLQKEREVFITKEPTDNPTGKLIRDILSKKIKEYDNRALAFLFTADRIDHFYNKENGIEKHLKENKIILCDRYYMSSYIYDIFRVNFNFSMHLHRVYDFLPAPFLTVLIDTTPQECIKRIKKRKIIDPYAEIEILTSLQKEYFRLIENSWNNEEKDNDKIYVVNGNQSIKKVTEDIWTVIKKYI